MRLQPFQIRMCRPSDAKAVAAIYEPIVRDTHLSAEFEVPTNEDMRRRIAETTATHPWLAAEQVNALLGYAYAYPFRSRSAYQWATEVSVYIHPDHQRRGVGRALYESLVACLRLQGYLHAVAVIALPNAASVALHELLGFVPVGLFPGICHKLGRWYDIGWWRLALGPHADPPAALRTPGELESSPRWAAALARGIAR